MSEGTKACSPTHQDEFEALAERVRVLESSICHCRDCVMHMDKARRGGIKGKPDLPCGDSANLDNGLDKGACVIQAPSEEAPAWQRVKVGDRVQHKKWGECLVENLRDRSGSHVQLIPRNDLGSGQTYWSLDDSILSILPPEPAVPVQAESDLAQVIAERDQLLADLKRVGCPPGFRVLNDGPDREVLMHDDDEECPVFETRVQAVLFAWANYEPDEETAIVEARKAVG